MRAEMHNYSTWVDETDPGVLLNHYTNKLLAAGFNILERTEKHFEPQGYTALFLLSESHFAIQTFPEENRTYIELSSCVPMQFYIFVASL